MCSFGTHHRLFRAMGLAKVTKGVSMDREEGLNRGSHLKKQQATYKWDCISETDVSYKGASRVV